MQSFETSLLVRDDCFESDYKSYNNVGFSCFEADENKELNCKCIRIYVNKCDNIYMIDFLYMAEKNSMLFGITVCDVIVPSFGKSFEKLKGYQFIEQLVVLSIEANNLELFYAIVDAMEIEKYGSCWWAILNKAYEKFATHLVLYCHEKHFTKQLHFYTKNYILMEIDRNKPIESIKFFAELADYNIDWIAYEAIENHPERTDIMKLLIEHYDQCAKYNKHNIDVLKKIFNLLEKDNNNTVH